MFRFCHLCNVIVLNNASAIVVNTSLNFNEPGLEALRFIIEFEKSMVNEESVKKMKVPILGNFHLNVENAILLCFYNFAGFLIKSNSIADNISVPFFI